MPNQCAELEASSTMLDSSVVSATGEIRSCPDRLEGGKSSSKRRSTGGPQDKQITQKQAKMFEAVEELNAATYSFAYCSVIVMVALQLCLVQNIFILHVCSAIRHDDLQIVRIFYS